MIFIRNIDYKTHMYSFHIQKLNKYQKEVYDFFYKNTANIEIVFKEENHNDPIPRINEENSSKKIVEARPEIRRSSRTTNLLRG